MNVIVIGLGSMERRPIRLLKKYNDSYKIIGIDLRKARKTINPYGEGNTSDKIIEVIKEYFNKDKISVRKKFYNLEVRI